MTKKLNPVSMKKENKRIILRYLMEKGKASRAELSKETGLAQSAVWRLIGELEDNGLLEVVGISANIGRSSVIYGPTKSFVTSIIYNVEIAETLVAVGYLDGSWEVVDSFDTQRDFEKFKNTVINSFEKITKEYPTRNHISKVVFS
ncbi:MAG: winged helix-turn-helix transcriptional regulator, partial [Fervidobacterium pennivorans]